MKVYKRIERARLNVCSWVGDPRPTFNGVLEYQLIALEILTQPSLFKRAESNFLADKKGFHHWNQVVIAPPKLL